MSICLVCHGNGICPICGGTGKITINPHPSPVYVDKSGSGYSICYACGGTGRCGQCGGTGQG